MAENYDFTPAPRAYGAGEAEEEGEEQCVEFGRSVKKQLFADLEAETPFRQASQRQAVLIYLRVRPKRPSEIAKQDPDCFHQLGDNKIMAVPPKHSKTYKNSRSETSHTFSFTHIFDPTIKQKELFDETLRPLLKDFFDGQNCLVFTYGVTNSGKVGRQCIVWPNTIPTRKKGEFFVFTQSLVAL